MALCSHRRRGSVLQAISGRENDGATRTRRSQAMNYLLELAEEKSAKHYVINKAVQLKGNQRATFAVSFSSDG